MSSPLVSVVMSVYDGQRFLSEAVESILNQTFRDFEFIIINDGSKDATINMLKNYAHSDSRIRVYHQETRGLIASLNRGCRLAKGKYIVRMDADDICLPSRIEKQVAYMEGNPEIGVLGTWLRLIDCSGRPLRIWKMPTSPSLIKWSLLFRDCIAGASVIMRTDLLVSLNFYRPEALHVEDYDLWARASHVTFLENIPEVLYLYRVWEGSICSAHSEIQRKNVIEIVMPAMMEPLLGYEVPEATRIALRQISMDIPITDILQAPKVASLIKKLRNAYLEKNTFKGVDARRVSRDSGERLYALASFASKSSLWEGLIMYFEAFRFNPRMPFLKIIKKIRRGFHLIPLRVTK